jgi:hypothetical protein
MLIACDFELGDNTDLSVIASYQHREYIRQQGLPVIGTLKDNPVGSSWSEIRPFKRKAPFSLLLGL